MTPREAASEMRERAAQIIERKKYPYWVVQAGLIRSLPLPDPRSEREYTQLEFQRGNESEGFRAGDA